MRCVLIVAPESLIRSDIVLDSAHGALRCYLTNLFHMNVHRNEEQTFVYRGTRPFSFFQFWYVLIVLAHSVGLSQMSDFSL